MEAQYAFATTGEKRDRCRDGTFGVVDSRRRSRANLESPVVVEREEGRSSWVKDGPGAPGRVVGPPLPASPPFRRLVVLPPTGPVGRTLPRLRRPNPKEIRPRSHPYQRRTRERRESSPAHLDRVKGSWTQNL